ncbi:secreted RxLR effector protein 161-like [Benincasa hispida]|uniref:secreted RxLR effector protein 161-like n=1 Tax=Benincasa hispida TaxID=102211 RepID=UPI0018FFB7FA|nr:secreted RxLR effector protein 161-like [Benincasa hispida]
MTEAKAVTTSIANHLKLSVENSPKDSDIEHQQIMSTVPYSQVVGSLMYLMVSTRPDIAYATSLLSDSEPELVGYVDLDYAGDLNKRRSLSGYIFLFGMCILNCKATLQSVVALSTTEAEFITLS